MKDDKNNELSDNDLESVAGGGLDYIQVTTGTGTRNITMIGGMVYVEDPPGHWRPETEEEWEARRIR